MREQHNPIRYRNWTDRMVPRRSWELLSMWDEGRWSQQYRAIESGSVDTARAVLEKPYLKSYKSCPFGCHFITNYAMGFPHPIPLFKFRKPIIITHHPEFVMSLLTAFLLILHLEPPTSNKTSTQRGVYISVLVLFSYLKRECGWKCVTPQGLLLPASKLYLWE